MDSNGGYVKLSNQNKMKKLNSKLMLFCIGILTGMFIVGITKPRYTIEKPVYTYVKVSDWDKETNPRKIAYYEHLSKE